MSIPTWAGRVSPVFDVAKQLLVVTIAEGRESSREQAAIEETQMLARVKRVTQLGVDVLICGAISGTLEAMLVSAGVRVLPHTCGAVEEILQAFASGRLPDKKYAMPGCCGQRRRFQARHRGGQAGFGLPGGTT
ncbi:MAG: NifB/NifX family molybdenum-iron cluster-binding protein [Planctomycetota bacterium]